MITVQDIMTREVLCAQADWSVERLAAFFFDNHISGAPVVNSKEHPLGVVSITDIAHYNTSTLFNSVHERPHDYYVHSLVKNQYSSQEARTFHLEDDSQVTAADIMTPVIFDVDINTPIQDAANVMIRGHIHRLFVTDNKKIVGIVSALDMLKIVRDLPH
jgi:predicted transcriptional regulator